MMSPAERFVAAYNAIDKHLRRLTDMGKGRGFVSVVERAAKSHPVVRQYETDLREFADLRNAIVHERTDAHVIAEPTEAVVAQIERLRDLVLQPPRVIPQFQKKVFILGPADTVATAVTAMYRKGFSQIPIYEGSRFTGLLTAGTVSRWLGQRVEDEIFDIAETAIAGVLAYSKAADTWRFLGRHASLVEAIDLFERSNRQGKRLEAVLITEDGSERQRPMGIITVWDLPQAYGLIALEG